jgi:serine protease Do
VDVLLEEPAPDERAAWSAARAATVAGVPGLDFATARARALRPGAPLASALPRDRARALVAALEGAGLRAGVQAVAAPRAASPLRLAAAAVAVAAVAVAVTVAVMTRPPPPPASPGPVPDPLPAAAATPALRPAPAPAVAAPAPDGPPRDLSVEELARLARPALAVLTCGGRLGSGFFVEAERLLTNAHVTCGPATPLEVKLADGRVLPGRVRASDEWLDYAVVDVPGARIAAPLALGDSTALVAGSPVVLVGTPMGLEATVHAGKVSFPARNLQGVAHVQVNADVNPGNSGGPLLDGRGRVVGVVTLKQEGADGVGFALPVEYARGPLEAPFADDGARQRWAATVARVERDDDGEAARFVGRLEQPLLLGAGAADGRLGIVVMRRFPGAPAPVPLTVEVRDGARVLCEVSGTATGWQPVEERFREASAQDRATRFARWMLRRKLAQDAFTAGVALDVSACPEETSQWTVVALRGAGEEGVAAYPAREIAASRRDARAQARRDEAAQARAEAWWREAFRGLKTRIAKLEDDRRILRGAVERRDDAALYDRAQRELPSIERELERRREELEELDRRASRESIPREWR